MGDKLVPIPGHVVAVGTIPPCDIDRAHGDAEYDANLARLGGGWGNVCGDCWAKYGPGKTGVGFGQRLILREA